MTDDPKWRRRKDARPAEICAAALTVFAEKGYAGAKMDDIARAAGVSKGAIYLYYPNKEEVFRAVVTDTLSPNVERLTTIIGSTDEPFADTVRKLLPMAVAMLSTVPIGPVVKMVIGESRNFPELARIWHDRILGPAIGILTNVIAKAQSRGDVRDGNPRIHAFSLMAPLLIAILWRETFTPIGGAPVDLEAVARQHIETALAGILVAENRP